MQRRPVRIHRLERAQVVDRPLHEVFEFFADARNLELITPPWLRFGLVREARIEMGVGTLIEYRLRLHGVPVRWVSAIEEWQENRLFVDRQVRGPYRFWRHEHLFQPVGGGTQIRDRIDYSLPLGSLGELAGSVFVHHDLERIFDYRAAVVVRLLGPAPVDPEGQSVQHQLQRDDQQPQRQADYCLEQPLTKRA